MTKRSVLFGITVIAVVLFACSCKDPAGVDKNKPFLIQRDTANLATLTIKTFDKQAKTGTFEFVQDGDPSGSFVEGEFIIKIQSTQNKFVVTKSSNDSYLAKKPYDINNKKVDLNGDLFDISKLLH